MKKIAIFASGSGSNARKIMEYFQTHPDIRVALLVSNKSDAGALEIARSFEVPTHTINRSSFYQSEELLDVLQAHEIDFIALAGFLWLVPAYLVQAYPQRIVNIHPALIPKYCGKGMFGHHVHEAVKAAGEIESGMTIHFVNEHYDEGDIILQVKTPLSPEDDAPQIAAKVLQLEHAHFAKTIEQILQNQSDAGA